MPLYFTRANQCQVWAIATNDTTSWNKFLSIPENNEASSNVNSVIGS